MLSMSITKGNQMMRGMKWLKNAEYLTDEDRALVLAKVEQAKAAGLEQVGIRCPTYTGEPHPIATIEYGAGRMIFDFVYREG